MRLKGMMMLTSLVLGLGVMAAGVEGGSMKPVQAGQSEQQVASKGSGDNLFQASGWSKNSPFFHFQDAALVQRIRRQVLPLVRLEQRSLPDGTIELKIVKDKKIEELAGANASNISGSWKYPLTYQPGEKGPFVIEFDYEAVSTGIHPIRACILLYYMRNGKTATLRAKPIKLVKGKRNTFRMTVDALPETDGVQVHLRFDGCGEMTFFNPRMSRQK